MNECYTKSPLNYTGGKHKLLPQILPLMPENIDTFVDLFCGGLNVGINVKAKHIVANDIELAVINMYLNLKSLEAETAFKMVNKVIEKYGLSKTNQDGYLQLREDYNNGDNGWEVFYAMLTHAFNNQIRFNKNGGYNMPFGKNRSSFNPSLQSKFLEFANKIDDKYTFTSKDFRSINLDKLSSNDFLYCDPPYLISTATYNENGGWSEELELELYKKLNIANKNGIKFALSNVMTHKGKDNDMLMEWSKNYKVHEISSTYSNSSYQRKDKDSLTREVLIVNY